MSLNIAILNVLTRRIIEHIYRRLPALLTPLSAVRVPAGSQEWPDRK